MGTNKKYKSKSLIVILFFAGLVGAGIAFYAYFSGFNRVVLEKFEGRLWELPARVYARPLELYSGMMLGPDMLEKELAERLELAGVEVLEARITHLAYASEIAGAMLQRQQATAVVAARFKIVEGAVSMVKMALDHLKDEGIADFDEEKRATMISNLMVVLCSEKSATPVVNTGTLYQ